MIKRLDLPVELVANRSSFRYRALLIPTKIRTRNARLYNEIGVQGYRNEFIDHVAPSLGHTRVSGDSNRFVGLRHRHRFVNRGVVKPVDTFINIVSHGISIQSCSIALTLERVNCEKN